MEIRFAPRKAGELRQLLADQQNPTSPKYHQWLATGGFDQRFGPVPSDVKAVSDWVGSEGFSVAPVADGVIRFSGKVAQAQHTFAVTIARYGDDSSFANIQDPMIPTRFVSR